MQSISELNTIQQEAVTYDCNKPLLILAGAGSGKTRVLTYRTAYLIGERKINPENILLLTFTNKAAEEMLKRVKTLVGGGGNLNVQGGTFHSFCAKLLRRYGQEIGISPSFAIFDDNDQIDVIKRAMSMLGIDAKTTKPSSVLGAISGAKNNMVTAGEYASYARGEFTQTVSRVYMAYQQLLRKYQAVDFDDLLLETVKLLKTQGELREQLQDKFQYILVDEYQDTNKAQYEITKELAIGHERLTAVGDAAQAIYSWRGANYKNLLMLKQDFPGLKTINLEQNYRSTQTILNAANTIISHNKNHPILKLWTDKGTGEKISVYESESELDEAKFVVDQIRAAERSKEFKYSDVAVLYRTNAQSRILEEAMLHSGITYSLVGGVRFYDRKEVKDILAYLRLLLNPSDEVSRKRAEKNGKGRLLKLETRFENYNLQTNTLEILDEVLRASGYLDQYDNMDEEDAMRIENIKELRSVAAEFPDLIEFMHQIALTEKEAKSRQRAQSFNAKGSVTLMTLHAAKGLEFPIVFMVGMEEGLFPHSRTLMNNEELEEERRLCYVGMTRAMEKLYLTYARRRLYFGTRNSNQVSRFLGDLPEELISVNTVIKQIRHVEESWGFDESGVWKWKP